MTNAFAPGLTNGLTSIFQLLVIQMLPEGSI
jgi:hypothetical protein